MAYDLDALERDAMLGITLPDAQQRAEAGRTFANALLDAFPEMVADLRALRAVEQAARLEHLDSPMPCPRRPQPEKGFLGACNICASLLALDAARHPHG